MFNHHFFAGKEAYAFIGAVAVALLLLAPSKAEAKRKFILINRGDDITKIADIPAAIAPAVKQVTGAMNPKIGYKYEKFGVFNLNLWTWNGDFVIYQDVTFWPLGKEGAAQMLGVDAAALKKPFFCTMPPGLIIIALLLALGFVFIAFVVGSDD